MASHWGPIRRTILAGLALLGLLLVARSGSPALFVQLAFSVFVAFAAVWVRGQYADSRDGRQWVFPLRWAGVVIAVAVAGLALLYATRRYGLSGLGAVLLAYVLVGSAVTEFRQASALPSEPRTRRYSVNPLRFGLWCCVAGVGMILAVAGSAALGRVPPLIVTVGAIGVAVLLAIPVGVGLLSEWAIRRLAVEGARQRRLRLGVGGLILVVAIAGVSAVLAHSLWVVGVLTVIALLVVAIVSTTQADVVVVMSVVALLGVTPPQDPMPGHDGSAPRRDVLVAFGDSYMSGEGAATYYASTDEGGGNQCRRSPTAWAAMAGQQRPFDGLEFYACSGARTAQVEFQQASGTVPGLAAAGKGAPVPQPSPGEERTQLDAYFAEHGPSDHPRFTPKMVVVTIGGNDAGFSTIGEMCLAPGDCSSQAALWMNSLDQVRRQLRATYLEINQAFAGTPVVVVPYPDPVTVTGACTQATLTGRERQFVHDFIANGLNRVARETAEEFGFYYLYGMESALETAHLQLCDKDNDGRPGLNFIGLRSVRGIAEQRFNPMNWSHSSLHPNERGHTAMLRTFEAWLSDQPDPMPARQPVSMAAIERRNDALNAQRARSRVDAETVAAREAPQCDLFDRSAAGCRSLGQHWTFQQVGLALVTDGLIGLATAIAAWVAAVAFFAGRRRRPRGVSDHERRSSMTAEPHPPQSEFIA